MTRRTLFTGFLLVHLVPAVLAQPVYDLDPNESVRLGLERNQRIRAAHAEAVAAHAAYRQIGSERLPTVRTMATYTRLIGDIPEVDVVLPGFEDRFTILPVEFDRYHSEVSVEQPVFTGFRLRNQVRAAGHEAEAALLDAEQQEVDVAFEIRRRYWGLHQALAVLEAMEAAVVHVDAHVRDVENRLEEGTTLRAELLAARSRRSEVLLEIVDAENAVRVAQLELNRLIGLPLDARVNPAAAVEVESRREEGSVPGAAIRPDLRALTERVDALRLQIDVARGAFLPDVALTGRFVYSRPNPYFFAEPDRFRGTGEAGIILRWNLFEGGGRQAQAVRARAQLESAEALLEDVREQVAVQMVHRRLELERSAEAAGVARQHVEETEEAFRVMQEQFSEGVVLSAQVLDAEFAYRTAQARHARALAELAVAQAGMLHARGDVW